MGASNINGPLQIHAESQENCTMCGAHTGNVNASLLTFDRKYGCKVIYRQHEGWKHNQFFIKIRHLHEA